MGILTLKLIGVNAYVPHTDGKALLAVLPNGSRLGTSPANALDGTPLPRHLPFLWERTVDANGNFSVITPQPFPGARLSFQLTGTPTALDMSAVTPLSAQGWMEVDANLLNAAPDDRIAGQVLIKNGLASVPPSGTCNMVWSRSFGNSLAPVVHDLTLTIDGVDSITATATPWVGVNPEDIYDRPKLGANETVELLVGNFCAEDALDWPRNSIAGRINDNDFKWVYGLSQSADLPTWISSGLPVPIVDGSEIHDDFTPTFAFSRFWGGGGGAGCECNGFIDKPGTFSY
jgi:hypothetical protein